MRVFHHKALGFATLWITVAVAQPPPQERLSFDVASVKPASIPSGVSLMEDGRIAVSRGGGVQIPSNTGGPGTDDPNRIHYPLISLKQLLRRAWDSYYEIDGPGWLDSQAVTVDATMPPDTSKAQFQEMLRNLITERFALRYHAGRKNITAYALAIAGNGPKIKVSEDQSEAEYARPARPTGRDKDGFPVLPPVSGKLWVSFGAGDRSRIIAQQVTMQVLAEKLGSQLKSVVTDATGLTAKYDFTLTYSSLEPAPPPANPSEEREPVSDIFAALQSQLGLRLERKPTSVEVFIIDHMERTPTKN